MSLFPAYATLKSEENLKIVSEQKGVSEAVDDASPSGSDASGEPPGRAEAALLASDEDAPPPRAPAPPPARRDYYEDRRRDTGNLRVSTLYSPGRPEYRSRSPPGGAAQRRAGRRPRRYHAPGAAPPPAADERLADERAAAYRRALADAPADERLWLRYLDFQECCGSASGALQAAEAGSARLPSSAALRERLHEAARRALPAEEYPTRLRDMLAAERDARARVELWARLLTALAGASAGSSAAVGAAAAAAVADTRHLPAAYPHLLYVYGAFLRSAGLWEQLVQLAELVTAMNFPPAGFPPPRDLAAERRAEAQLRDYEDKTIASGLPLGEVWARVERARGALHWRAPAAADDLAADLAADPQRAPSAHDAADLLLPVVCPRAALLLLAALLRLAEVPLLPAAEFAGRAAGPPSVAAAGWEAAGGAALLALLRAARRLPRDHPARPSPAAARRLLALTPQRLSGASDTTGFGEWVTALWEACALWADPAHRLALLCWRLRWLHARLLPLDPSEAAEARRLRGEARDALRRHAAGAPLAFGVFARLEAAVAGPARGLHAALAALRASLADDDAPPCHALYIARVVGELCAEEAGSAGSEAPEARWALVCAVLRRPLPPAPQLATPPPATLVAAALLQCEERCELLEQRHADEDDGDDDWGARLAAALLPADAEWACARAVLASPPRRRQLLGTLLSLDAPPPASLSWGALRFLEQGACSLVALAAAEHAAGPTARALLPLFPHNAYLALLSAGAPLWAWPAGGEGPEARLRALAPPRTDQAALAALLPALLRARVPDWPPAEAAVVARCAARLQRGASWRGGGALLGALRLEAQARAPGPLRTRAALYAALDAAPHSKWVYVRGAALVPPEAEALPDLLLDKQLRLHALPIELQAHEQRPTH